MRDYIESTEGLKNLTFLEKARLSKLLLMNSVTMLTYKGIARSPCVQGAGIINLKMPLRQPPWLMIPSPGKASWN